MERTIPSQIERFVDDHGIKIIAGLGLTKAIEVIIMAHVTPWWFRSVTWLLLAVFVLAVAARSDRVDV